MAAWLTSACRLRGPVALYFGRVGGSGRGTRDQQEDARELEHPFHQSRGAVEAARLHPCGRGDRAGADRLHRRPARDRSRRQASLATSACRRCRRSRTSRTALAAVGGRFQDVVKLNNYLTDMKYLPIFRAGARQLPGRRKPPGQHDHRDFRAWRATARCSRSRRWRCCRRRHARKPAAQGARRPRDYQSFAAETKVSSAKIGSRTTPDHTM